MAASTAAALDAESLVKIRALLAAETSEGVSLGLALLESLGATVADFDAALAPPVDRAVAAVAHGWRYGDEHARGEYDRYHRLVVAPRFYRDREADRQAGRSFLDLVEIPAGEFEMGSEEHDDAQPVHRVRITRAFLLGRTTVTQGQWWSVMGTRPWQCNWRFMEGAAITATHVSWADTVEFSARLTKLEQASDKLRGNQRYRLPTEAEWEYACRAGTKTRFSFGNEAWRLPEFAWFAQSLESYYEYEVGQKKPNPWGLYDMHGNICEWCSDWYDEDYYSQSPTADPEGPATGSDRVVRGGSWYNGSVDCRSAFRGHTHPTSHYHFYGFRVACELE